MMKLLSATPSPYARKVRIALVEKGIAFELLTEVPWYADAKAPTLNPLGKIPVLIPDDGGEPVYESRFILEWLEAKHPRPPLLPPEADGVLAARRLEVLADGVCDAAVLALLEATREQPSQVWIDRQRRKIVAGVAEVARLVRPGSRFADGDIFSLGDVAIGSMLGYLALRQPWFDWRGPHPHLAALFDRLSERPSFRDSVPVAQKIAERVM